MKGSATAKKRFTVITLCLSVGVLLYFLFTTDGIDALWRIKSNIEPIWLLWAVLAVIGRWLIEGYVLLILSRHLDPHWQFRKSFTVGMIGFLYSALTPFAAGEPMEIYAMNRMGMGAGASGSVITVKALIYQVVMLGYSLFFVAVKLAYFRQILIHLALIVLATLIINGIFITVMLTVMINAKLTKKILRLTMKVIYATRFCRHPRRLYRKIYRQLISFHDSAAIMGRSTPLYLKAGVLTLVQITFSSVIPFFIYRSFHLRGASFFTMLAADTFVTMASEFVPLPGATGGAEGGFFLFFQSAFGSAIIPAILLWRVITYYSSIVFGYLTTSIASKHHLM